jgi:GR25 family glycosyltransferase involved in LPS biosynthesis
MNIHVISLKRTPERLERFIHNNPNISFEIFEAVDSKKINLDVIPTNILPESSNYRPGAIGNALSHLSLWARAVEKNEVITICEDDALIHRDFISSSKKVINAIGDDFDFIAWGWNYDSTLWASPTPFLSPCKMEFNQESMRLNIGNFLSAPINSIPLRLHNSCGTIAYTITPSGAQKFLSCLLPLKNEVEVFIPNMAILKIKPTALDMAIGEAYTKTNSFVSFPPLVLTKNEIAESTVS